jgi:hypothetical protein
VGGFANDEIPLLVMMFYLFYDVEANHESNYFWCQLLLLCKRFVDDVIALFTDEYSSQLFRTTYNKLRPDNMHISHDISQLCSIFMDIKLFKGPRFTSSNLFDTSVYRKPIHKYVYIPQFLAHATFISIVTSELKRYRTFCTSDCESVKDLFFNRLLARGHNLVDLHTWFSNIPTRSQLLYTRLGRPLPLRFPCTNNLQDPTDASNHSTTTEHLTPLS